MRRKLRTIILIALPCIGIAACDPAMTIHERQGGNSRIPSTVSEECSLELHARDTRQLIGETWYDPELTVTNLSESPVAIDRIELVIQGVTYSLERWAENKVDRTIPAHATKRLNIGFDLGKRAVYEAFTA